MNSLIHLLEVVTLVLVGALIVQVSRCYLNFTRMERAQSKLAGETNPRSLSVRINISSEADAPIPSEIITRRNLPSVKEANTQQVSEIIQSTPESIEEPVIKEKAKEIAKEKAKEETAELSSSNGQILNDYIGEFFTESVNADIEAYKNPVEAAPAPLVETVSHSAVEHSSTASLDSSLTEKDNDEIIVVETHAKKINPVILGDETIDSEALPILTEVAEASEFAEDDSVITVMKEQDGRSASENVMSDKVVHAMLDEARLVCAS